MTTDKNLSMTPDNDKAPQRRKRPRKGPIIGFLLLLFLLGDRRGRVVVSVSAF